MFGSCAYCSYANRTKNVKIWDDEMICYSISENEMMTAGSYTVTDSSIIENMDEKLFKRYISYLKNIKSYQNFISSLLPT